MAWLMRESLLSEDNPEMVREDGILDWLIKTYTASKQSNLKIAADDPLLLDELAAPIGIPLLQKPPFPLSLQIKKMSGPLPDKLPNDPLGEVNSAIKNKIEQIEPGVHQFFPVDVFLPDGSKDEPRWWMKVCNRVDAVALEQCEDVYEYRPKPEQYPNWMYYRSNWDKRTKIAVHKDRVAGKAMWYDWRIQKNFFSEELGQYFIDNGIRGYCLPANELNHSSHVIEV
jgi:hypothetical protein